MWMNVWGGNKGWVGGECIDGGVDKGWVGGECIDGGRDKGWVGGCGVH